MAFFKGAAILVNNSPAILGQPGHHPGQFAPPGIGHGIVDCLQVLSEVPGKERLHSVQWNGSILDQQ